MAQAAPGRGPFRAAPEPAPDAAWPAPDLPLREMTGYEEEAIERRAGEDNTARLVNEVLARCLVPPGADHAAALSQVRALLVADRDAALVELRRRSLGDRVESEVACPGCGTPNAASFDLSSLPLTVPRPPRQVAATLPDGRTARLRLPDAADQEALLDAGVEGAAARRTLLLGRLLLRIGGDDGPFGPDAVRALPVAARHAMESAVDAATPALDLTMGLTCHACGTAFAAPLDVGAFFFSR